MALLETKLINSVQLKMNKDSHKCADELFEDWTDPQDNIRYYKNTIIQLLAIFYWNMLKDTTDREDRKNQENTKDKFVNKIESSDFDELKPIMHEIIDYYTSYQNIFTRGCDNPLIKRALDYIYNNSNTKITLDVLSEQFNVSRSYLSTLISQNTGTNLPNILNTFRIEKSLLLLKYTDKSISEISKEVGFQSDSYFCQQFKSLKKITPKKFRTIIKRDH